MIFERRAYTMEPGHVPAFDRAQIERGFEPVRSYMQRLVGYFATRSGPADQVVHLYRYDDLDDWNTRLRGLYAVPELTPYFVNTRKIVRRQVNEFFEPLPVATLNPLWGKGRDWLPGRDGPLADMAANPGLIVEERSFALSPGGLPAFVAACERHEGAFTVREPGRIGAFQAMIGELHRVCVWTWFEGADAREACNRRLEADPAWQGFIADIAPLLTGQSTLTLAPAPVPEMSPLFTSAR